MTRKLHEAGGKTGSAAYGRGTSENNLHGSPLGHDHRRTERLRILLVPLSVGVAVFLVARIMFQPFGDHFALLPLPLSLLVVILVRNSICRRGHSAAAGEQERREQPVVVHRFD